MKKWIAASLLLLIFTISAAAQTPAQKVPDFRFIRKNGSAFTRQDLVTGKPLFFIFFDVTCEHCRHSMQYLNSQYHKLAKAAIYLITMDPGSGAEAFLASQAPQLARQPNALLLRDTRRMFITRFQPRKFPSLFLYSSHRQLLLYSDEEKDLDRFVKMIQAYQ